MRWRGGVLTRYFAYLYFAGIRPHELKRHSSRESELVNLKTRTVTIPANISKTRHERHVTISSGLVTQAFRFIGKDFITPEIIAQLRQQLSEKEKDTLHKDIALPPAWITALLPPDHRMNRFLALPDSEKSAVFRAVGESIDHNPHFHSSLAASYRWVHLKLMKTPVTFTARVVRDGEWFITFSPEFPEGNGQGLTQDEALESLRESILLLLEDRREDARASLGKGETLIPLALA